MPDMSQTDKENESARQDSVQRSRELKTDMLKIAKRMGKSKDWRTYAGLKNLIEILTAWRVSNGRNTRGRY